MNWKQPIPSDIRENKSLDTISRLILYEILTLCQNRPYVFSFMHGNKRIRVELERGQCLLNVARFSRETGWGRKLISKSFEIISKWHTELHTEAMSFGLIITVKDYDKITKMDSEGATKDNARTTQGQQQEQEC